MKRATLLSLAVIACFATASGLAAQAAPAASAFSALKGMVVDSLHDVPLANATILIEGTSRTTKSNVDGL